MIIQPASSINIGKRYEILQCGSAGVVSELAQDLKWLEKSNITRQDFPLDHEFENERIMVLPPVIDMAGAHSATQSSD